jgi:hypothetical protein
MECAMTAYAFGKGRLEAAGCKATLYNVTLDFDQKLETLSGPNKVAVALGDGELRISGLAQSITVEEGVLPETGQIYFHTATSNFGVSMEVTIKLNNCRIKGNAFEAMADEHGNVFTLSMEN